MTEFNDQQTAVILSNHRQIAVVAGPGSGKTATTVGRIVQLIREGADPRQIVVITFTVAAAKELQHRISEQCTALLHGKDVTLGYCGTLHGWMFLLLKRYGVQIGLPETLAVIDETTAEVLLDETIEEMGYKGSKKLLAESMSDIPMLLGSKRLLGERLVSAAYHLKLITSGLVDFDSILGYGLHLLKSTHVGPLMCGKYLFVDEYQDGGDIDNRIYMAAQFEYKMFVGDPDQSIYGFRGAKPENFTKVAMRGDFELMRLETNYRSAPQVCDAANALISHNPNRLKKIIPFRQDSGFVRSHTFESEAVQESDLQTKVQKVIALGKTAAVLCRTNWQVDEITKLLRSKGLPVRVQKRAETPKDWNKVKLAVAFLLKPENDLLAFRMVTETRGLDTAKQFRREACIAMQSINQHKLKIGTLPVDAVPDFLARMEVLPESIDRVKSALAALPADYRTLETLGLAIASAETMQDDEGDQNGIVVCTIHVAKGREWDAVFLPNWVQELFPAKADGPDLEESRRVAFVAVTRARRWVWIGCPVQARRHAKAYRPEPCQSSQFVNELGISPSDP